MPVAPYSSPQSVVVFCSL